MNFKKKNVPKTAKELSKEELIEILKKKKECNTRAVQIVEALCENQIDESWFLSNLIHINQSHYDDVVAERSIIHLCGYPLCVKPLENIPKQQYKISLARKTVFDITDRKKYCSQSCFAAGEYIKNQLLTSPLWFRESEVIPQFKLKPKKAENLEAGEKPVEKIYRANSVDREISADKNDDKNVENDLLKKLYPNSGRILNNNDKSQCSIEGEDEKLYPNSGRTVDNDDPSKEDIRKLKADSEGNNFEDVARSEVSIEKKFEKLYPNSGRTVDNDDPSKEDIRKLKADSKGNNFEEVARSEVSIEKKFEKLYPNSGRTVDNDDPSKEDIRKLKADSKGNNFEEVAKSSKAFTDDDNISNNCISVVEKVEKAVDEWLNLKSLIYLLGEEAVKMKLKDNEAAFKEISKSVTMLTPSHKRFQDFERVFSLLNIGTDECSTKELKPLPDYSALKAEADNLNIKVKAFYSGQFEVPVSGSNETGNDGKGVADEGFELPLVDSHAQNALRRRVFLDRLNRVIPDVILSLQVGETLDMRQVSALVKTFTLSAHNIIFKPREWNLAALVLIKLLSLKLGPIRESFNASVTKHRATLLLLSYDVAPDYLDNLVEWLTDPQHILSKLSSM